MRIIVTGNRMASDKFCNKLLSRSSVFGITVFGEDCFPTYDRVHSGNFFSRENVTELNRLSPGVDEAGGAAILQFNFEGVQRSMFLKIYQQPSPIN